MDRDGRIPFRIRIGVTGHRTLEPEPWLVDVVRTQIRRVRGLLDPSAFTDSRLTVVSQLAEGADRLVVHEVLEDAQDRGEEARLEAVLPMPRDEYSRQQQFSLRSDDEFERLLERAVTVDEPGSASDSLGRAYEMAGDRLINRCDVLLVLWDGAPSGGRGGTAETLLRAAALGKPCIWISTVEPTVEDNLAPGSSEAFFHKVAELVRVPEERAPRPVALDGSSLESVQEAFTSLDEYNRAPLPRGGFEERLDRALTTSTASSDWVAAFFLRASLLAEHHQRRFRQSAWFLAFLATAAAAMFATAVSSSEHSWAWAEFGFLVLLLFGWLILILRLDFHSRWLSCRVLAERLRSARFLAPTGVSFDPTAGLKAIYAHRAGWLDRAFEEVWNGRPQSATREVSEDQLPRVKRWLAEDWIGGQMHYHDGAARYHRRRARIFTATVLLLFFLTILLAALHAWDPDEEKWVWLSITLPAVAASLGVMLTVGQHRALAERSTLMGSNLAVVQRAVLDADATTLARTSAEAAQVIAEESGDWFGALWFMNIEHPP